MSPEEELRKAAEAQRWLDDKLFMAARADVYAQLQASRRAAKTTDGVQCADLVRLEQIADRFFGYFEQLAQTGKFAQLDLDRAERQRRGMMDGLLSFAKFGRNGL